MPALDNHLSTRSYLDGYTATQMDLSVFDAITVPSSDFPHASRWYTHIRSFSAAKRGSLPGKYETLKAAAPAAKAEPAAQQKKENKKDKKEKGKKPEAATAPPVDEKAVAKKLAKVIKEGGKKGVEIEGAADMGGLEFFTTQLDEPEGDLDLIVEGMNGMNAEPDPTGEERKGGSGPVGKMIFSAGVEQLAIICNVPATKLAKVDQMEWIKVVCDSVGGKILKTIPAATTELKQTTGDLVLGVALGDKDKGIFPIKMKDTALAASIAFLRSKGAFPEDDGDSDDEMVFGDDTTFDDFE